MITSGREPITKGDEMFVLQGRKLATFILLSCVVVSSSYANVANADESVGFGDVSFVYIPLNDEDSLTGSAEAVGSTEKDGRSSVKGSAYALVSQIGQPVYSVAHSTHSAMCSMAFTWITNVINPELPSNSIDGTYSLAASASHVSYGTGYATVSAQYLASGLGGVNSNVSMSGGFHRTPPAGSSSFSESFDFAFSAHASMGWLTSGKGTGAYKIKL
jgi:hypothetical protein